MNSFATILASGATDFEYVTQGLSRALWDRTTVIVLFGGGMLIAGFLFYFFSDKKPLPLFGARRKKSVDAASGVEKCPHCGTKNRVGNGMSGYRPICGHCKKPLTKLNVQKSGMSMADRHSDDAFVVQGMLITSGACFILGLFWPLITISKRVDVWIFNLVNEQNTISLASGLMGLLSKSELFLFAVIFVFTVVFPALKLGTLSTVWFAKISPDMASKVTQFLSLVGKWSMLDIFVVGVLVALLKLGDMVSVQVHAGVVLFGISALVSMFLTLKLTKLISAKA